MHLQQLDLLKAAKGFLYSKHLVFEIGEDGSLPAPTQSGTDTESPSLNWLSDYVVALAGSTAIHTVGPWVRVCQEREPP